MRLFSLLDLKVAFRMLRRYPGLTVLAVVSMAFAIMVGAGTFEVTQQVLHPTIPLPDGDRVVQIQMTNVAESRADRRLLYDLRVWREELESVEELGAYRAVDRSLRFGDDAPLGVMVAELDAAALGAARTPALLGRLLTREDEAPGAPLAVLLSHELWSNRFGADPNVLGATIELTGTPGTIVGVMPEGFRYPTSGDVWAPLRPGAITGPGDGPPIDVVGRLAPGASLDRATDEVSALTAAMASQFAQRYTGLTSKVRRLGLSSLDPTFDPGALIALIFAGSNLPVILFLALVCGNVALLMFARAATRESELVVRNALGASRGRIVGQLLAEALALAAIAGAVGLVATNFVLRRLFDVFQREVFSGYPLPFWVHPSLSPTSIIYAVALTMLAAVLAGVVPGLRVTRSVAGGLRQGSAGGGGFRFSGIWTAVIVSQIAITVMFTSVSVSLLEGASGGPLGILTDEQDAIQTPQLGSPAEDYLVLSAWYEPDAPDPARLASTLDALRVQLEADPRVAGVTFADRGLSSYHPWRKVEVDGPAAPPRWGERGHRTGDAFVALDYFDVLGLPIISGRAFRASDLEAGANTVIVNQAFVDDILGDRNAVGTRIRYIASWENRAPDQEPGPWMEIVGVVPTTGKMSEFGSTGVYHAATPEGWGGAAITVHVSDAATFAGPTLAAAARVDPDLLVGGVMPLDRITANENDFYAFWRWVLLITSMVAVLLSLGGIYSVMSVTLSQRTREIGVRVALGSGRLRILGAVFRKPLRQIALGIAAGGVAMPLLMVGEVEMDRGDWAFFLSSVVLVTLVCSLACVVPTARALRIQPAEALRSE